MTIETTTTETTETEAETTETEVETTETALLKPGRMVSLRSTVRGGVEYDREDLPTACDCALADGPRAEVRGPDHATSCPMGEGEAVKAWKTVRRIKDPVEWKRAKAVRGRAVAKVWHACVFTEFGLVLPDDRRAKFEEILTEQRQLVHEHNKTTQHTHVTLRVLRSRLERDEETETSLAAEVDEVVEDMEACAAASDVDGARKTALKAQKLTAIFSSDVAARVMEKVKAARDAATAAAKAARDAAKPKVDDEEEEAAKEAKAVKKAAKEAKAAEAKAAKEAKAADGKAKAKVEDKAKAKAKVDKAKAAKEAKAADGEAKAKVEERAAKAKAKVDERMARNAVKAAEIKAKAAEKAARKDAAKKARAAEKSAAAVKTARA